MSKPNKFSDKLSSLISTLSRQANLIITNKFNLSKIVYIMI